MYCLFDSISIFENNVNLPLGDANRKIKHWWTPRKSYSVEELLVHINNDTVRRMSYYIARGYRNNVDILNICFKISSPMWDIITEL